MTIAAKRRFDPAKFFHPESVSLSGAETALGARIFARLQGFSGALVEDNADMALVADVDVPAALARHAARGTRGALVFSEADNLGPLAKQLGLRVLGPYSYGVLVPGVNLNASVFTAAPPKGKLALVGQSASLARLVIDWAAANQVGFSHIAGIGGNADMGFGVVLDTLSRDPGTTAILIELDRLRDPRAFLAAARAAARLRPVVAIAPGLRLREANRAAMEAAFARAGVLLTGTIAEFLAAAETLTLVKPAKSERLAIVSNSVLAGRLAADAALEAGIALAELAPETAQVLALRLGFTPGPGPIDVGGRRCCCRKPRRCYPRRRRWAAFLSFMRQMRRMTH